MHAGPHATIATSRMKHRPLVGRRCERKKLYINSYNVLRHDQKNVSPLMGNLPKLRINRPSRCIKNCGVDNAGEFLLKCSNRCYATAEKAYICVFVCFATKAFHLKLVCDLSTDAFVAALKRFHISPWSMQT